ncbi:MAG TPA: response regulator [Candidatus Dormibacteraeota bacterium]
MIETRRVLVVEDNDVNQMLVRAVLEREGYTVEMAGSSPEAMDSVRRSLPDLILMDIQLPGEDGLALTRRLKADPLTARVPIVALTAHAMEGDREQALLAGCHGFISKPIDTRLFGPQIRQFISGGAQASEREDAI